MYERSVNIQFIFLTQLYHRICENNQKSRDFTTFLMREVLGVNDGMLQAVDFAKILVHDMGISHCDLNAGMAEQFLYIHDISIISKKIRGERVPKRVWMDILFQSCLNSRILNHHLNYSGINLLPTFLLFRDEKSRIWIIAKREVFINVSMGDGIDKAYSRLVTLSNYRKAIYTILNLGTLHTA